MNKIALALGLISIFVLAALSGCIQQPQEETIKIGVLGSLTGAFAPYGEAAVRAIEIAVEEINSRGGVGGKKIELVIEDSKNDAKTATAAAQKLISVDKVHAVLTDTTTMTLSVAPIAEQSMVPVIGYLSTSPAVSDAGDYVFRTSPSNIEGMILLAEFALQELNFKKVGVISELIDYPQGIKRVFVENFELLGGKITADETFESKATDVKTQLLKIKEGKPDAVLVLAQSPGTGALVLKQIKELGFNTTILGNEAMSSAEIIRLMGEAADGIISAEPDFDVSNELTAGLIKKYKEKGYNEPPQWIYIATAYDAMHIIAEAISAVGTSGEKIKEHLYTMRNRQGAVGKLSFDEKGDPKMNYSIKTVKNGKVVKYAGENE